MQWQLRQKHPSSQHRNGRERTSTWQQSSQLKLLHPFHVAEPDKPSDRHGLYTDTQATANAAQRCSPLFAPG